MSKLIFDPKVAPVASIAGELAVPSEHLVAQWLRQRFAKPPVWQPEITDEHNLLLQKLPLRPASVLIPLVAREDGMTLLLTQRSAHLHDHPGQVSFPGGRAEKTDASAIETALRETEEEVGIHRSHLDVLGILPDYCTVTGYLVTPVVSIVTPPFSLQPDPFEVAEVFEVPLSFLMDGAHHQRRIAEFPLGLGRRTFYAMPYQRFFIWGATAGMLRNLFHFLRA
ncbi:CoA pyrophosphatase [Herminiimonas sp. CN]|uniref:CoA pyrophosphatase n=1 Tax=Herminiimonas sp. CN TaxID=1349818 RepID=UPI0004733E0F|nr:CoA pyrophosphatase [Herminiimonas sp. CN]